MKALLAAAFALLPLLAFCEPERFALILCAKSGDQSLYEVNKALCERTQNALLKAGFKKDGVKTFAEWTPQAPPSADAVCAQLEALKGKLSEDSQLWLFLYGDANVNQKGLSVATSGKRLRATQLASLLDEIKARQFVFFMTRQSSAAMAPLKSKPRLVVTAAADESQMNPPKLPGFLLSEIEASPAKPLVENLKAAFEKLKKDYESSGIALAETPQLFDGESVLQYPFDGSSADLASISLAPPPSLAQESLAPKAGEKEAKKDESAQKLNPPTEETKAIVERAAKLAKGHEGFPAFVLSSEERLSISSDLARVHTEKTSTYLIDEVAAETLANTSFIDSPPNQETKVLRARLIRPDGSYLDALPDSAPYDIKLGRRITQLKFPGAGAGCLIQLEVSSSTLPSSGIPFLEDRITISGQYPVEAASVEVSYPKSLKLNFKLRNSSVKPEPGETTPYAISQVYKFSKVQAYEPLPGDPPREECLVSLSACSLASWAEFSAWASRIVSNNNALDDNAKATAERLAKGLKTDKEKLKALYEFLCELRYETTPMGVQGFRPRKPGDICASRYGDCKDKANALSAMARHLGIEGYMVLLGRGLFSDSSFPSWQFNHAIAFFPKVEGYPNGLWLDATDGSTPFGTLPPGDIGRAGLILNGEKSEFKTVESPGERKNSLRQVVKLERKADGQFEGTLSIESDGLQDYMLRQQFKRLSPLQAQNFLQLLFNESYAGLAVGKPTFSPFHDLSMPFKIEAKVSGLWDGRQPRPPLNLWNLVAMEGRERPLVLFDGQPLSLRYELYVSGVQAKGPGAKTSASVPELADCAGESVASAGGVEASFSFELKRGIVKAEECKPLRDAILKLYSCDIMQNMK